MPDERTPTAVRRAALIADVQRVSELLAQCVAEARPWTCPSGVTYSPRSRRSTGG